MRNCVRCGFRKWLKPDFERFAKLPTGETVRRMKCGRCGNHQNEEPPQEAQKPKVLYFDLETALSKYANFGRFVPSKFMRTDALIQRSFIICWSAGWITEGEGFHQVFSDGVRQEEALQCDDKRILKSLFDLLDSADYVVGHNSDAFDVKTVNYRFIANGMPAPYTYKQIDTFKLAKKYFRADSNKLEEWSVLFGGNPKHDMSFDDWFTIAMSGDPERLLKMEMYCRGDVREGIGVFKKMTAWIESGGYKVFK